MTDDSDNWPLPRYDIGQSKHIHALGVVATLYNQMEFSLFCLLMDYTKLSSETTQWLIANISNNLRLELLRRCVGENESDPTTKDHVHHYAACFDICTENRNFLMHSMSSKPNDNASLSFMKASRNDPKKVNHINLCLEDIRCVADDIANTMTFGGLLHIYFAFRDFPQSPEFSEEMRRTYSTLPKRPQLPSKLLKPNSPVPKGGQPRRRSSRG